MTQPSARKFAPRKFVLSSLVAFTVIAAFAAMRLWRLTDFSLDGDEIFSLLLARSDWRQLFAGATEDAIHPPLLYILLKGWVAIGGESLLWLRLFPFTASILCLIPVFLLCRDLKVSPAARNLAIGIAAVHPFALYYAQHMRMYCLLMLFGLISAWCFVRYMDQPSWINLAWLTLVNIFLVYAQYYGWLIVGLELLYLIWRRLPVRAFFISILVTAVAFSPWAWSAGRILRGRGLAENLGWVPRPVISDMCWFFVDLTGLSEFPKVAKWGTVAMLGILLLLYRRYQDRRMHWLMLLWIAPAPIGFLLSQWLSQSIWGHRHLVFALWPFLIVFADSLSRLRLAAFTAALALIGLWAVFAIEFHTRDDRKFQWDALTLTMLAHENSTEKYSNAERIPLYAIDPYLHYPLWFYLDCLKTGKTGPFGPRINSIQGVPALAAIAAKFDVLKTNSITDVRGRHFWVGYTDSSWREFHTPRQILEEKGCHAGSEITSRDRYHVVTLIPIDCKDD